MMGTWKVKRGSRRSRWVVGSIGLALTITGTYLSAQSAWGIGIPVFFFGLALLVWVTRDW